VRSIRSRIVSRGCGTVSSTGPRASATRGSQSSGSHRSAGASSQAVPSSTSTSQAPPSLPLRHRAMRKSCHAASAPPARPQLYADRVPEPSSPLAIQPERSGSVCVPSLSAPTHAPPHIGRLAIASCPPLTTLMPVLRRRLQGNLRFCQHALPPGPSVFIPRTSAAVVSEDLENFTACRRISRCGFDFYGLLHRGRCINPSNGRRASDSAPGYRICLWGSIMPYRTFLAISHSPHSHLEILVKKDNATDVTV